jgi:hypothetical protein
LPEAVHRFLFITEKKYDYRMHMFLLTPKWFRRWISKVFQMDNLAIEETLTWMESVMEISNDQ